MTDEEPCINCTERDICPRCGEVSFFEAHEDDSDDQRCEECSFTFADGGRPEVDCYCYEQQEAQETKYEMLRNWSPFFGDEGGDDGSVYTMNRDLYDE